MHGSIRRCQFKKRHRLVCLTRVVERRRAAVEVRGQRALQGPLPFPVPLRDAVRHAEADAVDVKIAFARIKGAEGMGTIDPCVVGIVGIGPRGGGEGGGPELGDGLEEARVLGHFELPMHVVPVQHPARPARGGEGAEVPSGRLEVVDVL